MIKKDIVLRWAQELAKVIARIMGKETKEALELIDQALRDQMDLYGESLDQLPDEGLIRFLEEEKDLNLAQLEFLATLLDRQAVLLMEIGDFAQSRRKFEKALIIFEHIDSQQGLFSFERLGKIKTIRQQLEELGHSDSDQQNHN